MISIPIVEKSIDGYLVKTSADGIQIFLTDETNPIVTLPLAFAVKLGEFAGENIYGAEEEIIAPRGGAVTITTTLIPGGRTELPEDNAYNFGEILDNDVFTGISAIVTCSLGVDETDTPKVYIDGVGSGTMVFDTDHWKYSPSAPVVFAIGHHVLSATFIDVIDGSHTTTLEIHFMTIPH